MSAADKIFLIGLPGSGKSTLGKQISRSLGIPFIDLDDEIEKTTGQKVGEIFKAGEAGFRGIETQTLKALIANNMKFIMATGGGAPCFNENLKLMNDSGLTIYIDVPVEEIVARISAQSIDRPLLKGDLNEKISGLNEQRRSIYSRAKIIATGSNLKVEDVIQLLNNR